MASMLKKEDRYEAVIAVEILTPVSIGDGNELNKLSDFAIVGGKVYHIDQDKLSKLLINRGWIDDYLNKIKNNRGYKFNLKSYLSEKEEDIGKILKPEPYNFEGNSSDNCPMATAVKSNGRLYIPGSTLKGAIRTSIAYHILQLNHDSQIKQFVSQYSEAIKRVEPQLAIWESLESKEERRRFDKREIKKVQKEIESAFDKLYQSIFMGKIEGATEEGYISRFLMFNDSCSMDMLQEYRICCRQHLKKAEKTLSIGRECIPPKAKTAFNLYLPNVKFDAESGKGLEFVESGDIEQLFAIINKFAYDSIDRDLTDLEDSLHFFKERAAVDEYDELFDGYNNLFERIESAGKEEAYIQLGFGKSYFGNSLGVLFRNQYPEFFGKMVRLMEMGKPGQKLFPVTKTIETASNSPMGWVRLTIKN